jgi:Zincin-like metallopeptidase
MFLAKDHAAFDTDRRRLAVWADIRHLQGDLLKSGNKGKLQQHGRNPAAEVVDLLYSEVKQVGGTWRSHFPGTLQQVVPPHWGETGYVSEELVAELGSAFLCADLELHQEPREDNAMHTLRIGWEF